MVRDQHTALGCSCLVAFRSLGFLCSYLLAREYSDDEEDDEEAGRDDDDVDDGNAEDDDEHGCCVGGRHSHDPGYEGHAERAVRGC